MTIRLFRLITILLIFSLVLPFGCSEAFKYADDAKSVRTFEASNILSTTATVSGIVNTDNGTNLSARGICYSTSASPTISGDKKLDNIPSVGSFSCLLENLSPNTTYYARAFATNDNGVAYGEELTFTTQVALTPILSATTASSITATGATLFGNITYSGKSSITSRGFCYSDTSTTPTIADTKVTNSTTGIGTFSNTITGLTYEKKYYVRAFATNSYGTSYSSTITFTTSAAALPTLNESSVSSITATGASLTGNVTDSGQSNVTIRGFCYSATSTTPTIADTKVTNNTTGIGTFSNTITGLTYEKKYYVRAFATNSYGTSYSSVMTFTTAALKIGDTYQGGIIAYIYVSGDPGYIPGETHGLIVPSSDQSNGIAWGCSNVAINTSYTLDSGKANTEAILANCGTNTAAYICDSLTLNGYSDWYLPSLTELVKVYDNRTAIGNFTNPIYWSSSQDGSNRTALAQVFGSASGMYIGAIYETNRTSLHSVRAMRSF